MESYYEEVSKEINELYDNGQLSDYEKLKLLLELDKVDALDKICLQLEDIEQEIDSVRYEIERGL